MWHEYIGKLFAKIGTQLAAVGAAVGAVLLLILGHRRRVSKAEKTGREQGTETEQARIERESIKSERDLEQRADEIEDQVRRDTATDDDLRRRMRDAATDRDPE